MAIIDVSRKRCLTKKMEKLEILFDELRSDCLDLADDLSEEVSLREGLETEVDEKEEALHQMEKEIRMLVALIQHLDVALPQNGHFIDINGYVSAGDPLKGCYEWDGGGWF